MRRDVATLLLELGQALPDYVRNVTRFLNGPTEAIDFLKNSGRFARKFHGTFGQSHDITHPRPVPVILDHLNQVFELSDITADAFEFVHKLTKMVHRVSELDDCDILDDDGPIDNDGRSLFSIPDRQQRVAAVIHGHVLDDEFHWDFRFKVNKQLSGWTIQAKHGELFSKKATAYPKFPHSLSWLQVRNESFPPPHGAIICQENSFDLRVQFGLQSQDVREYFLTGGKSINGILTFQRILDSCEKFSWDVSMSEELLPRVLRCEAVDKGIMPDDGHSGIPVSLMKVTPPEFQYWRVQGEEARTLRDALVMEKFFTSERLKLIDSGDIVHLTENFSIYVPEKLPPLTVTPKSSPK